MSHELKPGDPAPDFEAIAVGGPHAEPTKVRLADLRGTPIVLYFYPKDDTPGCTVQACAMRDKWEQVRSSGAHIYGVSIDSPESHRKFIDKYQLPFSLLSDESQAMVKAYGVWIEKSIYGKKTFGTERSTFCIRPDGTIKSIMRKVKADEHVDHLLEDFLTKRRD